MEFDNVGDVIDFITEAKIPIVFEYEGWGAWNFRNKGEYQTLDIQLKGYFNVQDNIEAIRIFEGLLNKTSLTEARIYRLDSYHIRPFELDRIRNIELKRIGNIELNHIRDIELDRIRNNPLNDLEPREGDTISFKTGGRSPVTRDPNIPEFINIYNSKADIFKVDSSKSKGKVGVLKVDLEECLNNKRTETMENEIKMETSESKIEKLESENENLKSENANLRKQLEKLAITNSLIEQKEQDINELKEKLRLHSEEPNKDKQLPYKSQMTVARMLYAILAEHKYDLSATKGKTNQLIELASQSHGTSVSRNFISEWIKLANQAKNDSIK